MKERIEYLFLQYYYSKSTRKELDEFFSIVQSAKHDAEISELVKQVYEELKQAEPSLTYIDENGKLVLKEPVWNTEKASASRRSLSSFQMVAASFILLCAFSGLFYWYKFELSSQKENEVILQKFTDQSQQTHIMLSDSTAITLNAASSISYPEKFNGKIREVTLKGEAFFDVKHADKIPFIIHTGKITTTVLGTAFNIKAYDNSSVISISVKRGKVSVLRDKKVIATLIKGQAVKVPQHAGPTADENDKKLYTTNDVGTWQQGYLIYEDEPFSEIINDLKRTYNVDIAIKDPQLNNILITSSFKREIGAERALRIICKLTDSKLQLSNQKFIIN